MIDATPLGTSAVQIRLMPKPLRLDYERAFPVDVARSDTRRINEHCRRLVQMFVNRAQHNTAVEFRFSQAVLDETRVEGHSLTTVRKRLVAYLKLSPYFSVVKLPMPKSKGNDTPKFQNVYSVNGLRDTNSPGYNILPVNSRDWRASPTVWYFVVTHLVVGFFCQ